MKEVKICPSILSANFIDLKKDVLLVQKYGLNILHIDVMDGHFVPNISFGACVLSSILENTNVYADVHLMLEQPLRHIGSFLQKGVVNITIHIECSDRILDCLDKIKNFGASCAIAINPNTDVEKLMPYINDIDMVVVMAVEPGYGGQKLLPSTFKKIDYLKNLRPDLNIEVDGGVNIENVSGVLKAGANFLVVGSYIFKSGNMSRSIKKIKKEVSKFRL